MRTGFPINHGARMTPDERARMIIGFLQRAAAGDNTAYYVSHALCSLDLHYERGRISKEWALQIIGALALVNSPVLAMFPDPAQRNLASRGISGAVHMAALWGKLDRGPRPDIADHVAPIIARWLRNACHNICIEGDLHDLAQRAIAARPAPTHEAPAILQ